MKGNLELIVGLILTLILKYQISLAKMDDDDDNIKDITPKQALLAWCKVKIPRIFPMNNFNKDWNDGRAITCLVDAVAPGLFPECEKLLKLDPSEALANDRQSMETADKWLGIPQVGSFYSIIIIIIIIIIIHRNSEYFICYHFFSGALARSKRAPGDHHG